jgi:hypothetical protein
LFRPFLFVHIFKSLSFSLSFYTFFLVFFSFSV